MARSLGIPLSEWDEWSDDDRAWMMAAHLVELELEARKLAETCPVCGGPATECQNPDNQWAFETETKRCFLTKARIQAAGSHEKDKYSAALVVSSKFNPALKKSIRNRNMVRRVHG